MVVLSETTICQDHRTVMDNNALEKKIADAIEKQLGENFMESSENNSFTEKVEEIEAEHLLLREAFDLIEFRLDKILNNAHLQGNSKDIIVIDDDEVGSVPGASSPPSLAAVSKNSDVAQTNSSEQASTDSHVSPVSEQPEPESGCASYSSSSNSTGSASQSPSALDALDHTDISTTSQPRNGDESITVEVMESGVAGGIVDDVDHNMDTSCDVSAVVEPSLEAEHRSGSSSSSDASSDLELLKTSLFPTPQKNEVCNNDSPVFIPAIARNDTLSSSPLEDSDETKVLQPIAPMPITNHPNAEDGITVIETSAATDMDGVVAANAVVASFSTDIVTPPSRKKKMPIAAKVPDANVSDASSSSSHVTSLDLKASIKRKLRGLPGYQFVPDAKVLCKLDRGDVWTEGVILKVLHKKDGKEKFKVKLFHAPKDNGTFSENFMAPMIPPVRQNVYVGCRVIAERPFETIDPQRSSKIKSADSEVTDVLYGGILAEKSCELNRHRYLVFFDDGFAQYVLKKRLFHVPFPSENVWDDLPANIRGFTKEYLEEYPWRPLLKVKVGQIIVTEWNGKWLKAKVISVDGSLVKVLFEVDNRTEMIYRGSSRLEPLMKELDRRDAEALLGKQKKKKKEKQQEKLQSDAIVDFNITRFCFGVSPFSATDQDGSEQLRLWGEERPRLSGMLFGGPQEGDAVNARKRKLSSHDEKERPVRRNSERDTHRSQDKSDNSSDSSISTSTVCSLETAVTAANQLSALISERSSKSTSSANMSPDKSTKLRPRHPRKFCCDHEYAIKSPSEIINDRKLAGSHVCSVDCKLKMFISQKEKARHNSLAIPMLLGWKRESAKKKPGYHRDIYYRTPCKRRLRNIEEVAKYLCETKAKNVSIDQFCFDQNVSCRDQGYTFPDAKVMIDDLSGGLERVPVQCVNEINNDKPPSVIYTPSRLASPCVVVNTDPSFLPCCDCTDNCEDKTKCACARLTIDGSNAIDNIKDGSTGYLFRRLINCVPTGLYECNTNCRCNKGCFNRVAQNGITLRLQIFMTESKGWGLRCLDDIAEGTFICTYAGQILNEDMANREGTDFGDEYLAELDHIESVELAKEGYESVVPEFVTQTEPGQTTPLNSASGIALPTKRRRLTTGEDDNASYDEMGNQQIQSTTGDVQSQIISVETAVATATSVVDLTTPFDAGEQKIVLPQPSSLRRMIDKLKSQVKCQSLPVKKKEADDTPMITDFTATTSSSHTVKLQRPDSPVVVSDDSEPKESIQRATALSEKVLLMLKDGKKPRAFACKSTSAATLKMFSSPRSSTGSFLRRRNAAVPLVVIQDSPERTENAPKPSPVERKSTRQFFGEDYCYVIDAKSVGNAGRYINHSCAPNLFVQNVFVDTHDLRFPWVAFFSQRNIPSLTELTWDYSYDVGSVRDKIIKCNCGAPECRGRLL